MSQDTIETTDVINPWLYQRLAGDSLLNGMTTTIAEGIVLGQTTGTWVVFMLESARDITTHDGVIIDVDAIYLVKAVARAASYDAVRPAAKRVHALLHRARATTASGSLTCTRESIVQYPELDDGVQYRHLGGRYRFRADALGV